MTEVLLIQKRPGLGVLAFWMDTAGPNRAAATTGSSKSGGQASEW